MAEMLYGSICLSDIPRDLFKKVKCKDGNERTFLNIKVVRRKETGKYGHTHFVSCEPKKEEKVDGVNYICGDLKEFVPMSNSPSAEEISAAPPAADDDLPF